MNAVVCGEPHEVSVENVEDPAAVEPPVGVVVGTAATNTCGPDLHTLDGRRLAEPGLGLGHDGLRGRERLPESGPRRDGR